MATPVLILGKPGAGKSTSLRNLDPKKTIVISPNSKDLPFKGSTKNYVEGTNLFRSNDIDSIQSTLAAVSASKPEITTVIIEDLSHFYSARILNPTFMTRTSGNDAFAKWLEFGASVYQALFSNAGNLRKDLMVVVINHSDIKDDGSIGFKSAGKLLDNTIDVPSYFTWILHSVVLPKSTEGKYKFQTNVDANRLAKSPMGAFSELYVDNDLKSIIETINEYQN